MGRATPGELAAMRRVMAEAMDDGAFGVAYALIYPPDSFAGTDEIVAVCEFVAEHHGIYITHVRSEAEWIRYSWHSSCTPCGRQAARRAV